MNQKNIVRVSETQELEIPLEIKQQLQPLSEYEVILYQNEIILKKIKKTNQSPSTLRPGSGKSILRHAGTWEGDDFEECLQAVYENRNSDPIKLSSIKQTRSQFKN